MRTRSWTVALLVFDEVELLDVAGVVQALTQCGRHWNWRPFRVITVATRVGPVATRNQIRLEATHDLTSCPEPEIVIIPGGYGARVASESAPIVEFVRERATRAELLGSVGHGGLVLARAGLVGDADLAADPTRPLCESGRVITARSGAASIDLGLAIIARLLGKKHALAVASELGHSFYESEKLTIEILPPER